MAVFPYDLNTLLGGAARVMYAPAASVAVPVDPDDIFAQKDPYTKRTGWENFGATKDSFTYNTGLEKSGFDIQNATGVVLEDVTSITRSVTVSVANIDKDILPIIENASSVGSVAAQAGVMSAYDEVNTGNFTSVTRYRIAFVAQRHKASGGVVEGGAVGTRGRFVVGVGLLAEISADDRALELAKGELSAIPVTFTFFPDETQTTGEEFGRWWFERAGTI